MNMDDNVLFTVKTAALAVVAMLTALWGWFGWAIILLAALMLLDWIVGTAVARSHGTWCSAKLREGAWHKAGMILVVIIALAADWLIASTIDAIPTIQLPFDYTVLLAPLVVLWYIVGELGSLAEHAISVGAPVPAWLLNALEVGQRTLDKAGEAITPDNQDEDDGGAQDDH